MKLGVLEPGGQLVLSLKPSEQTATKADIAAVMDRLEAVSAQLTARAGPTR